MDFYSLYFIRLIVNIVIIFLDYVKVIKYIIEVNGIKVIDLVYELYLFSWLILIL